MLYAKKGNKVVEIDERMKAHYLNDGFTIYENGKAVEYGRGVGVSMEDYKRVMAENARLKEDIKALEQMLASKEAEKEPVGTVDADTVKEETEVKVYKTKGRSKKK